MKEMRMSEKKELIKFLDEIGESARRYKLIATWETRLDLSMIEEIKTAIENKKLEHINLKREIAGLEAEIKDLKWQLSGEEP